MCVLLGSGIFILGLAYFCNHILIMCLDSWQSRLLRKEGEKENDKFHSGYIVCEVHTAELSGKEV